MWKFHWHHTDDKGKELTTTQTSVPIGEPVPVPDVGPGNTLTAVTLEPQETALDPTEASELVPSSMPSEPFTIPSVAPLSPEPGETGPGTESEDLPDEPLPVDLLGFTP